MKEIRIPYDRKKARLFLWIFFIVMLVMIAATIALIGSGSTGMALVFIAFNVLAGIALATRYREYSNPHQELILNAEGLTLIGNKFVSWPNISRLEIKNDEDGRFLRIHTHVSFNNAMIGRTKMLSVDPREYQYDFDQLVQLIERYRDHYTAK